MIFVYQLVAIDAVAVAVDFHDLKPTSLTNRLIGTRTLVHENPTIRVANDVKSQAGSTFGFKHAI